jgi:hypothetical protein
MYFLASSAELIGGILPLAASYIPWMAMILGPISYILRVRRDLLPIADSLDQGGYFSSVASVGSNFSSEKATSSRQTSGAS